ncbi:MAG: hypothetical protein NT013_21670 [Planctomycetia bacterium]|nr:hypothetical protein [Planctomycetia bacterium]
MNSTTSPSAKNRAVWAVLGLVAIVLFLAIMRDGGKNDDPLLALANDARKLQADKNWGDAANKWKELLGQCPEGDAKYDDFRNEAERSLEESQKQQSIPQIGENIKVPPPSNRPSEVKEPPREITKEDLLSWYPIGRTDQHVSLADINGRGIKRNWGLEGEVHFQYAGRIQTETKVIESDPEHGRLVIDLTIQEVSQNLAVSKVKLHLRLPETPWLNIAWSQLETVALRRYPKYVVIKKLVDLLAEAAKKLDPRAEKTLTWLHEHLVKENGSSLTQADEVQLIARIGELSGAKVRIEYATDLGVQFISRQNEIPLDEDQLIRIAHASSLLLDYVVAQAAERKPGDQWTLAMRDVGGIAAALAMGDGLAGTVDLVREPKLAESEDDVLSVTGGSFSATVSDGIQNSLARARIQSGTVIYSGAKKLVRSGELKFGGEAKQFSKDHLLFGAESMRDVTVRAIYEAQRVESATR